MAEIERHKQICDGIHNLYIEKNKKYGDSVEKTYKEYGNTALLLRLDDKLNRLKQILLNGESDTSDERIADTLLDLANYAIIACTILEKEGVTNAEQYTKNVQ